MKKRMLGILALFVVLSGLAHAGPTLSTTVTIKSPPPPPPPTLSKNCGSGGC
jgi:hypothetical protein